MSDASTIRMLRPFRQRVGSPMFLADHFQSPPENFHNSEFVEQDIIRSEEDIAVPVPDITSGSRHNESTRFVNKQYEPAIYMEQGVIQSFHQMDGRRARTRSRIRTTRPTRRWKRRTSARNSSRRFGAPSS